MGTEKIAEEARKVHRSVSVRCVVCGEAHHHSRWTNGCEHCMGTCKLY